MQFVLHVRHLVGKRTSPGFHLCIGCTLDTKMFLPSLDTNLTVPYTKSGIRTGSLGSLGNFTSFGAFVGRIVEFQHIIGQVHQIFASMTRLDRIQYEIGRC